MAVAAGTGTSFDLPVRNFGFCKRRARCITGLGSSATGRERRDDHPHRPAGGLPHPPHPSWARWRAEQPWRPQWRRFLRWRCGAWAVQDRRVRLMATPHPRRSLVLVAKQVRRVLRQVDKTAIDERPPVIHPHNDRLAIIQIGDTDIDRHWQRRMGRGERVAVEHFAVGGQLAVEIGAVPGGDAGFVVARLLLRINTKMPAT